MMLERCLFPLKATCSPPAWSGYSSSAFFNNCCATVCVSKLLIDRFSMLDGWSELRGLFIYLLHTIRKFRSGWHYNFLKGYPILENKLKIGAFSGHFYLKIGAFQAIFICVMTMTNLSNICHVHSTFVWPTLCMKTINNYMYKNMYFELILRSIICI